MDLYQLVSYFICEIRALEEELDSEDLGYQGHPDWAKRNDELEEVMTQMSLSHGHDPQEVQDGMTRVWEADYCDYVSEEDCLEVLGYDTD